MSPSAPHLVNGRSRPHEVTHFRTEGTAIHAIQLSSDGSLLAIGNDSGQLEIRCCSEGGQTWPVVDSFTTGASIRSVLWHPTLPKTVVVGSANGLIHKIAFIQSGDQQRSIIQHGDVSGFIHAMAMSPDGKDLVVAHGRQVAIVKDPFSERDQLGRVVDIPAVDQLRRRREDGDLDLLQLGIPRGIHFIGDNAFAMTFFGTTPIGIFSRLDGSLLSIIRLRNSGLVASSAISPSGEKLAIFNLLDGVDWYSLSHGTYLSTTKYAMGGSRLESNLVMGVAFVDEDTVAVGQMDGAVYLASFGHSSVAPYMIINHRTREPIQTLTVGNSEGKPLIFTVHKRNHYPNTSEITVWTMRPLVSQRRPQSDSSLAIDVLQSVKVHRIAIVVVCVAVAIKLLLSASSSKTISGIDAPAPRIQRHLQIPSRPVVCKPETTTARYYQTSTVTVTQRPSGVSVCVCTLSGVVTAHEGVPTIGADVEVAVGRPFY